MCDVCGAYLSVLDSDRRLADHFGGKVRAHADSTAKSPPTDNLQTPDALGLPRIAQHAAKIQGRARAAEDGTALRAYTLWASRRTPGSFRR